MPTKEEEKEDKELNTCPWCGVYVQEHELKFIDYRGYSWHCKCRTESDQAIQKEPDGGFRQFHRTDPEPKPLDHDGGIMDRKLTEKEFQILKNLLTRTKIITKMEDNEIYKYAISIAENGDLSVLIEGWEGEPDIFAKEAYVDVPFNMEKFLEE